MDRKSLMSLHTIVAAFIMPVAIVFLVTGSLYTWGIKGSVNTEKVTETLETPLNTQSIDSVVEHVTHFIESKGYSAPSGTYNFTLNGPSVSGRWSGANMDLSFSTSYDGKTLVYEMRHTTWYSHLVQLHKAKGGTAFKVYAVILAVSLLLLLISGYMMAFQMPKYRKQALVATVTGLLVFFVMVLIS
ncbi:hypothetical protein EP331_02230 [bacterium]|nr:MAG: hypothetical protein EP331_02230 [bacterium]